MHSLVQEGRNLLPEVVEYDGFMAASGATGGWHPDDHTQFLQILQAARCGPFPSTVNSFLGQTQLPGFPL